MRSAVKQERARLAAHSADKKKRRLAKAMASVGRLVGKDYTAWSGIELRIDPDRFLSELDKTSAAFAKAGATNNAMMQHSPGEYTSNQSTPFRRVGKDPQESSVSQEASPSMASQTSIPTTSTATPQSALSDLVATEKREIMREIRRVKREVEEYARYKEVMEPKAMQMKADLEELVATRESLQDTLSGESQQNENGGLAEELTRMIADCELRRHNARHEVVRYEDQVQEMIDVVEAEALQIRGHIDSRLAEKNTSEQAQRDLKERIRAKDVLLETAIALDHKSQSLRHNIETLTSQEQDAHERTAVTQRHIEALVAQGKMVDMDARNVARQAQELKEGLAAAGLASSQAQEDSTTLRRALKEKQAESDAADRLIAQLGLRLRQDGGTGDSATAPVPVQAGEAQAA